MLSTEREREREMDNRDNTDSIVLSLTQTNQRLIDAKKINSSDKRPIPGCIVPSIANIHDLFGDVMRTSESIQEDFSEVADLASKINIQQVAFENGCKVLLLTAAQSRQDLDNMIKDPNHPVWKDTIAHRNIDTLMARFYHLCLVALEHFQESLSELKLVLHALKGQQRKKAKRFWLNKSSPSINGITEEFPRLVQKLRDYNDIFCTLVWQALPRRSDHKFDPSAGRDLGCQIRPVRVSQHHLGCIQQASQVLYETLSYKWTCLDHDHEAHFLNISLNFDPEKAGAIIGDRDFKFNIAVTSPSFDGPCRLIVGTVHNDFCMSKMFEGDRSSRNSFIGDRVAGTAVRTKSCDISELDADKVDQQARGQRAGAFVCPESLHNSVPDLGSEEDLCGRLRKSSINMQSKQMTGCSYLGFLDTKSDINFLFSSVIGDDYRNQGSHSLDDVLLRANDERRELPLEDRLRTALFLTVEVLHLRTSSWLHRAWSSKDIHFFGSNDHEKCALDKPFFQIELNNGTARSPVCGLKSSPATRLCLLSLALVLIELAFSAPWRKLQLPERIAESLVEWEGNFLNLLRLTDTVSRELGSRYAKVVQTCLFLGLDANETHGLEKPELDEVIFEDIVKELDRCLSAVTFQPDL